MSAFEDFIYTELPLRSVIIRQATDGAIANGNPNTSVSPKVNNSPVGTFFLRDDVDPKTLWYKAGTGATYWLPFATTSGGTGASALSQLSDVRLTSPTTGQTLVYSGGMWVNSGATASNIIVSGDLLPLVSGVSNIGSSSKAFSSLYLANATITTPPRVNAYNIVHQFTNTGGDGKTPSYGLQSGSTSNLLYGTTRLGGLLAGGTLYSYNLTTTDYTTLYDFALNDINQPSSPGNNLIFSGTTIYGTTTTGGRNNNGTLYQFNLQTAEMTILYDDDNVAGFRSPRGIALSGNSIYGLTNGLGSSVSGVLYRYDFDNNLSGECFFYDSYGTICLYLSGDRGTEWQNYIAQNGWVIELALSGDPIGVQFYTVYDAVYDSELGATRLDDWGEYGGSTGHTLFSATINTATILHYFTGVGQGRNPVGRPIIYNDRVYGVTQFGVTGTFGSNGTLWEYKTTTPTGYTVLHQFIGTNGTYPIYSPILVNNTLYGVTSLGGTSARGTIYQYNLSNSTYTVLHQFSGTSSPSSAQQQLTLWNGVLYGCSNTGGLNNQGSLFAYNLATSALTVDYSFSATTGNAPTTNLTVVNNDMYGIATTDTTSNGVLFRIIYTNQSYNYATINLDEVNMYYDTTQLNLNKSLNVNGSISATTYYGDGSNLTGIAGVSTSIFNTYTGVTAPAYYANLNTFNTYTANTYSKLESNANFLSARTFNTYTATTYTKTETNTNFLSANTSFYTQVQANANFLSASTQVQNNFLLSGGTIYGALTINQNSSASSQAALYAFSELVAPILFIPNKSYYYNNKIYVTVEFSNLSGALTCYNLNTSTLQTLHNFSGGTDGTNPCAMIIENDVLYGATNSTLYTYNLSTSAYTILTGITNNNHDVLTLSNNVLYGSTTTGLYAYNLNTSTYKALAASNDINYGVLMRNNILYGVDARYLYAYNLLTSASTTLYDFGAIVPNTKLVIYQDNLLYGLTSTGGINSAGTIYEYNLTTSGMTFLYPMPLNVEDYKSPVIVGDLLYFVNDYTIGIDNGRIWTFDLITHQLRTKYTFNLTDSYTKGKRPLCIDITGNTIYGVTYGGGNIIDDGTIFSLTMSFVERQIVATNGNITCNGILGYTNWNYVINKPTTLANYGILNDRLTSLVVTGLTARTYVSSTPTGATGAGAWKLGKKVTATVSALTTGYIELEVDGVLYKLGLVT